jgi:hypothetical protein
MNHRLRLLPPFVRLWLLLVLPLRFNGANEKMPHDPDPIA